MNEEARVAGWSQAQLGDVLSVIRGVAFPSTAKSLSNLPNHIACLRTTNVQTKVEWDDLWFIPATYVRRDEQKVRPLDILISTANSFELVGKVSQVREMPCEATLGAFISMIRVPHGIDPGFVYYQLLTHDRQAALRSMASTTTNISNISTTKLARLELSFSPIDEQRRIVAKIEELFSDLDAGVVALERVRANLKRYRAAVLKAAVEGKLTEDWRAQHPNTEPASVLLERILTDRRRQWEKDQFAKFAQAGKQPPKGWQAGYRDPALPSNLRCEDIPTSWTNATLDQLSQFITSGSRGWAKYYSDNGAMFIRAQDIKTDRLRLDDVARVTVTPGAEGERTRVKTHDLLITITGANVTKSALVRVDLNDAYVSQHVALVRPVMTDYMAYFFYWVVCPSRGRMLLEKEAYGAGKPGLNLDNLRNLTFGLPPLAEQAQIVTEIELRLSIVDEIEAQVDANLKRSARLRQGILKRAFEGRLVPQDPTDEPAEKLLERIRRERQSPNVLHDAVRQGRTGNVCKPQSSNQLLLPGVGLADPGGDK